MTRIDFHSNVPDKIAYACRLVRKARLRAAEQRIVLLSAVAQLEELDQALWTFSDIDFLPHVFASDPLAAATPILLTGDDDAELAHHQILINLTDTVPRNFAQFERMFEIVAADDADTGAGRQRYAHYKQRGYPLTHFVAEQT